MTRKHLTKPYTRKTRAGSEVSIYYDPILAKVVTHGADRPQALQRMLAAIDRYVVAGVTTNLPFLRRLAGLPQVGVGFQGIGFSRAPRRAAWPRSGGVAAGGPAAI